MNYLKLILIGIAGVILGAYLGRRRARGRVKEKESLIARQAEEKRVNKEKILTYLASRSEISNDDVEGLLAVSNATAERYLDELEKEGQLTQVGATGRSVYYKKA